MRSGKLTILAAVLLLGSAAARADVAISNKATSNMSCAGGVCTATARKAVLNVGELQAMLGSGDVTVKTGGGATNIVVKEALSWTSTSRLTLDANQSLEFDKPVTVAGSGAVTIMTNDGGSGGDLLFTDKASLTFWDLNSSLIINGNIYTLVGDIATLAADIAANPLGFYALANSINAKHQTFDTVPIPTEFSGALEGLGQTISHLRLKHGLVKREGLFALIDTFGVVRDIRVTKVNLGSMKVDVYVGAIAGENRGLLSGVFSDGTIGAAWGGGGLVGTNSGTISRSSSNANIAAGVSGGGLVGDCVGGFIYRSYASGNVTGNNVVGGLAGGGASITLSYATGSVAGGDNALIGGLVGVGHDQIDQSYATGPVTGSNRALAGGLVGNTESAITNSYATGSVQAGNGADIGGLAGRSVGVTLSYATGHMSAGDRSHVGGLVGVTKSSSNDYWDLDTSGVSIGCGHGKCLDIVGLTTQQFQSGLPEGFDPKIWGQSPNINNGYPYLLENPAQ